jgi:uncharacterized protein (UPF0332 family)
MPEKLIAKLEKEGKLKKQKAGIAQIEALLRQAIFDLKEANKIAHLAERATYILAYMAMLKAGRALLLLKGFRPADGAQHKTVVEVTGAFLGAKYKNLTQHFESMRRKRNEITYEAGALVSKAEAKKALLDSISLVKNILREAEEHNPQLKLKFELLY